jgi:hypothetical protein
MKITTDVDIDVADREKLLAIIEQTPAAMLKSKPVRKHPSGIYITDIPYDPIHDMASLDYKEAEERGYFKLDILNVHVYEHVKDEKHLIELMREPDWAMLEEPSIVRQLIHINNSYNILRKMPEPVDSIPRLAMFLAVIRPAKKHLQGLPWKEVAETVWDKESDGYGFKKSHSLGYAHLVGIHMNLLKEKG